VAPIGIPTGPTGDGVTPPIPVGDEADAAGPVKDVVVAVTHVPDAVPVMPPPSNDVAAGRLALVEDPVPDDMFVVDMPVIDVLPDDIPGIEVPAPDDIPADELPVPDDVAVADVPVDACGSEPPEPLHVEATFAPGVNGDIPFVAGLTPSVDISVAPKGIRVGGTGAAGPTPRGDVRLRGGRGAPVCANAGPQLNRTVAVATIAKRGIMGSTSVMRSGGLMSQDRSAHSTCFTHLAVTFPILRRLDACPP
jgi:hypothetical protein